MSTSRFVYVTYIRATPEKLWEALTAPEFTRAYWHGVTHEIGVEPSKFIEAVSSGWPFILSSLKSLLETGKPLKATSG